MQNLWRRLRGTAQSKAQRELAADPMATLTRGLASLERELAQAEQSLRAIAAVRHDADLRRAEAGETADRYVGQARRALAVGREDLARQALALSREAEQKRKEMEANDAEIARQQAALEAARDGLRRQIEELRARRATAGASLAAAEAQLRVREAMAATADDVAAMGRSLERLDEQTLGAQARAEALAELAGGEAGPLEQELRRLERRQRLEQDLERVKREALARREGKKGPAEPKGGDRQ